MASYQQHISFSIIIGCLCGLIGYYGLHYSIMVSLLAALLAAVAGFIPDLDSDHSVPARETFALLAAVVPTLVLRRLDAGALPLEIVTVLIASLYLLIRFGGSAIFRKLTSHRGMWHSLPAVVILGEVVFLIYQHLPLRVRLFVTISAMVGMLSHLVLDEIYAVDFMGLRFKRNQFSGSALSLYSPSVGATGFAYLIMVGLGLLIYQEVGNVLGLPALSHSIIPGFLRF